MITYNEAQLAQWVQEARQAADHLDYEWDALAVNWPLAAESVVLEVGSYKGRWALQIARRYNPHLYCFEPQQWACEVTRRVLAGFEKAQVFNFGLADRDGDGVLFNAGTDGASLVQPGGEMEDIALQEATAVLNDLNIKRIDLALFNIEGYEYTLLPYLFNCGVFPLRLMVQCHDLPGRDYRDLHDLLAVHYRPLWNFGTMLSAWER